MTKLEWRDDVEVELISHDASDDLVVASARVSTLGAESNPENAEEYQGLINFLMKNRHGSPFEHNQFVFKVSAPIFVWREHMRHRIGFSYNEESGRYKQLEPVFYLPYEGRKLKQTGKAGHYNLQEGEESLRWIVQDEIEHANKVAYLSYEAMLHAGVAREVARMVLPVNIFSTAYVTCNARSLMHFLSLRTNVEDSRFSSFPQREIEMVAEKYEEMFSVLMPLTYKAFNRNGRVAP